MRIEFLQADEDEFFEFDKRQDWTRRAPEELVEAALSILHYRRGKATEREVVDEQADAIISAVHAAWHVSGRVSITALNEAIARKLKKANAHD